MTLSDLATADLALDGARIRPLTHRGAIWAHDYVSPEPWRWSTRGIDLAGEDQATAVMVAAQAAGLKVAV